MTNTYQKGALFRAPFLIISLFVDMTVLAFDKIISIFV